jgi:FtsP/CotA-like multicopper oxidase with cupredoxin domain
MVTPLHLHGFFFLVLDEKQEPVRPLEWKDTVDIPFEQTRRLSWVSVACQTCPIPPSPMRVVTS